MNNFNQKFFKNNHPLGGEASKWIPYLRYMNDLKEKLEYKKKSPYKDETL